jgi:hypothetical protein
MPITILKMAVSVVLLSISTLCIAGKAPVVEKLDELTGVTITHSRTPLVMSPDSLYRPTQDKDYVEIGAIEVNRMGKLKYFLWLGISDIELLRRSELRPTEYESIVLLLDDQPLQLDLAGWTPAVIGAGEPIYKKFYESSVDAYYAVTLEQIQRLARADGIKVRTTGAEPKEFIPRFKTVQAKNDLAGFVRTVAE